ncbi:MAG: arylsulfatase [Sphingomonadaceae bacterium]|nr:arylsulfatase [Sphingomonadaceae bacterium]
MKAIRLLAGCAVAVVLSVQAIAGTQPTGPSLPFPAQEFKGTISPSYARARPDLHRPRTAPAGAPNVLVVMTDDVGFGAASTFGGPIPTPNLDRLAANGLVYNRFHTTAMCSPTRAALLTGRNHHPVHNGVVANLTTGFPGYDNLLPKSAATLAEVLRQYGWNTAMIGKHHNAPEAQVSAQGPFDLWPTGLGFEYFFGFMAAETNQFHPALYRGIQRVEQPVNTVMARGSILERELTDDAIRYVRQQKSVDPDKPFFLYYAAPTAHGPLQAPEDWITKFHGKFDKGWDATRKDIFARQKAMGIIPANTVMTPMPDGIPAWDSLDPGQKRVAARWMETYAAMLAYQDYQFGRLMDELEREGQRDNTLVIFIEGDNGAATEGHFFGKMNPMGGFANEVDESDAYALEQIDAIGGPESAGNYGFGWALALNAPNPYAKQYASHLGGLRNGMVISWPARIQSRGIRSQFTHVNDVMPTILELLGIEPPASVNGVEQQPIDGTSFAYSFAAPAAPERHQTQYFEMMGNRGIYHDGWWAGTTPLRVPWGNAYSSGRDPMEYDWELYDLRSDPAQARNLAAKEPERLAAMLALFDSEAWANNVYPLDDRLTLARFQAAAKRPRAKYTYWGSGVSVPVVNAAPLVGLGFTIEAQLDLSEAPASGAILAYGSKFAGWSFAMEDGVPVVVMAASQVPGDQSIVRANEPVPEGKVKLSFEFLRETGRNAGGEMVIRANGKEIGRGRIKRSISNLVEQTDTLDIGFDADTPVVEGKGSQPFTGKIERVDVMPKFPQPPR